MTFPAINRLYPAPFGALFIYRRRRANGGWAIVSDQQGRPLADTAGMRDEVRGMSIVFNSSLIPFLTHPFVFHTRSGRLEWRAAMRCTGCGCEWEPEGFYRTASGEPVQPCKVCRCDTASIYYLRNAERVREKRRADYHAQIEAKRAYYRAYRRQQRQVQATT